MPHCLVALRSSLDTPAWVSKMKMTSGAPEVSWGSQWRRSVDLEKKRVQDELTRQWLDTFPPEAFAVGLAILTRPRSAETELASLV